MSKTKVAFLRDTDNGDVFAYFPDEIADPHGNRMCYAHIGQHSACSPFYVEQSCKDATEEEYKDLKCELESIGYKLDVVKWAGSIATLTIQQIKSLTKYTSPFFFSPDTMRFFGQSMSSFTVERQEDGRFKINAPSTDSRGVHMGDTVRYYNPENNKLENN